MKSIVLLSGMLFASAGVVIAKPLNNPPIPGGDVMKVLPGAVANTLTGGAASVLANDLDPDGDAIAASVFSYPSHGMLVFNADGTFAYTNTDPSAQSDIFTYYVCDTKGACSTGTVNIIIGF